MVKAMMSAATFEQDKNETLSTEISDEVLENAGSTVYFAAYTREDGAEKTTLRAL
jgi:hypothetical protein